MEIQREISMIVAVHYSSVTQNRHYVFSTLFRLNGGSHEYPRNGVDTREHMLMPDEFPLKNDTVAGHV